MMIEEQENGRAPSLSLGPPPAGMKGESTMQGNGANAGLLKLVAFLVILNLGFVLFMVKRLSDGKAEATDAGALTSDPQHASMGAGLESLAIALEDRSLWNEAGREWRAVAQKRKDAEAKAKAYYRAGLMLEKAHEAEQAAAAFIAAEGLLPEGDHSTLKNKIGQRIVNCLRILGRSGEIGRELARRTQSDQPEKGQAKVLAYVSGDPVTEADLDALIETQVDRMLANSPGPRDPSVRKQALRRFREPEQRKKVLQELIKQEVLVRRARELGLDREDQFLNTLHQVERSVLSDTLLQKEIGARLVPTESDIKNYYEAHKARFKNPATTRLLMIETKTQKEAEALAETLKVKTQIDFQEVAASQSIHAETKAALGKIKAPLVRGGSVLDLPYSKALNVFAFDTSNVVSKALKINDRFFLFFAQERTKASVRAFQEAAQEVQYLYLQTKQRELSNALIQDLQARYKIKLVKDNAPKAETVKGVPAK